MIKVTWPTLKAFITSKALPVQYIEDDYCYKIYVIDNGFSLYTELDKDPSDTTDRDDFVTNYKSTANTNLNQLDSDGAAIVRQKAAKKGWTYSSVPIEFETARRNDSVYSKLADGTDRIGITLKAYDTDSIEITSDDYLSNIVKTVIDFEPTYDYEVIGGAIRTATDILSDMRLWIIAVPDIPALNGGSKEMAGGVNLHYLSPNNEYSVDGRVSKYLTYSAIYHTNKLRFILKYPAGTNEKLSIVLELYRA